MNTENIVLYGGTKVGNGTTKECQDMMELYKVETLFLEKRSGVSTT